MTAASNLRLGSMNIIAKAQFSQLDQKAFSTLEEKAKKDFLMALSSSLCSMNGLPN
jgi:hypothetical protein